MTDTLFRVIDSIMGSGKTTHIINKLKQAGEGTARYIVVTPYLKEVERFRSSVPELNFQQPDNSRTTKLADMHRLIAKGHNIVATHSLFHHWNLETLVLLEAHQYHLIIDETIDCTRPYGSASNEPDPKDVMFLLDSGDITAKENGLLQWSSRRSPGNHFKQVQDDCEAGRLFLTGSEERDGLMFWEFPISLLRTFHSVTLLTYMFDGSLMSAYLKGHGISPDLLTLDESRNLVTWSMAEEARASANLAKLIHVLEDDRLNSQGEDGHAFSRSWFGQCSRQDLQAIGNHTYNALQNRFKATAKNAMWSCVLEQRDKISPKSFKKAFQPCNLRATNELSDRRNLAYLRNVYMNPLLAQFYRHHRAGSPNADRYALSELLQWVFRSAIRNDEPINLYLPSSRMRKLLYDWMNAHETLLPEAA